MCLVTALLHSRPPGSERMQSSERCGHRQQLAPEYETAATKRKGTVSLAKIDCTVNSETCGRFGVNGYPTTLKILRNGEDFAAYDGPRSAAS
ncbi:unnamed protein product [Oncorhynchus mykiss]|uniref:Thioredoxin domain-containing protein n=1 Tax=Oncorhynchus mykiss TaxID=8022 RepID=A0A060X3S9_ONCMY|nr:unnamed protein product [Oncorhynchus mykiss]